MKALETHTSPREIESQLYESERCIDDLFPQSIEEVREAHAMFGTTPVELPERLRSPRAVLDRIILKEQAKQEPSAFGKLLTMLRTEKKLTIEQLAAKTDLDADDLRKVESDPNDVAQPFAVSVLARFFNLQPQKLARLAGLTRQSDDSSLAGVLSVAACAKPNFDLLTREEKRVFHQFVKQLRS